MQLKTEKLKIAVRNMFSLKEDAASHEEIRDRLISGGKITGTNMCVLICAMIIASAGLITNSTAVIIGAMLISPLMGSILATAYGVVSNDFPLARNHIVGFIIQIAMSVAASTVFFLIAPEKGATSELLARTSPSFYDIIIATAGGIAGVIGQTRKDKANNIIPGVAIATALMPPLCTCGYSIANGSWRMLLGAGYLFLVNTYFIFLSSAVVLSVLKIPKVRELTEKEWKRLCRGMIRNAVIVAVPSLVPIILMVLGINPAN